MLSSNVFKAIGDLALTAKGRRDREHQDFLLFFRAVVETVPSEVASLFGCMGGVAVITNGKAETFGIELTATDYIWWKQKIDQLGVRFVERPAAIQVQMLARLSRQAESQRLEPEERKALIALLDGPQDARAQS